MRAGMNASSDSRQEVMASFGVSGLVPISTAIAGSGGAITVDPTFSMNSGGHDERDQAFFRFRRERRGQEPGLHDPLAAQAIAEPGKPPRSCMTTIRCEIPTPAQASTGLSALKLDLRRWPL
jgi:hypothetical protein